MRVTKYSLRIFFSDLSGDPDSGRDRVFYGLSRVATQRYVLYFQDYTNYYGFEVGEE